MVTLKKITLTDFLSHQDTSIDFNENEKILFDGNSGAGKSSIFEAITWGLYGQGRSSNTSLVRKGAKKALVEVQLNRDGETIFITRTANISGKHTLELLIQHSDTEPRVAIPTSGVRESQAYIDTELIGASYLLFVNSVAYVQGNADSFVMQSAAKRKELLLEIVKAEDYQKYYEKARTTLQALEYDRQRTSGQVIELTSRAEGLRARIGDRGEHFKVITDNSALLSAIQPDITILEEKKASIMVIRDSIGRISYNLSEAKNTLKDLEGTIEKQRNSTRDRKYYETEIITLSPMSQYDPIIEKSTLELSILKETLKGLESDANKRQHVLNSKPTVSRMKTDHINELKESIARMEAQPICPAGEECPYGPRHIVRQIKSQKAELKKCEEEVNNIRGQVSSWQAAVEALPPKPDLSIILGKISETEALIVDSDFAKTKLHYAEERMKNIDTSVAEIPVIEEKVIEKKKQILDLTSEKYAAERSTTVAAVTKITDELLEKKALQSFYQSEIARATATLETIESDEKEVKATEGKIADIVAGMATGNEKARKIAMAKEAFGPKGIETIVIDYLLPKLEDRINNILMKLSDFRVRLDTQRKSADGDGVVEGLFITILNEMNEELPFESYSGGEKLKITVAISEALATLQKVGFRLIDETLSALDENSLESFASVLDSLMSDYKQIFVISHIPEIKEMLDRRVFLVKNNNISYVKN